MDKIIRVSSVQGFADSYTNAEKPSNLNLLDFTIPTGMNIDLSKSYVAINSEITSSTGKPLNAINFLKVDGTDFYNVPTSALVRNCHISNDKGQIESIRRLDSLNMGLYGLTDEAEARKSNMNTFATFADGRGIGNRTSFNLDCVTNNVNPKGDAFRPANTSRNLSRDIKIPLKDMFGMCVSEAYSTDKFGETRIHIETNFVKGAAAGLISQVLGGDERASLMFDGTHNYGDMVAQNGIANGSSTVKLESSGTYQNWGLIYPFFVGQEVLISATMTGGGSSITDSAHTITAIQFQDDNSITPDGTAKMFMTVDPVLFDNTLGAGITVNLTDIAVKAKTDQVLTNVINRAELVLHTSMEQPDDDIVFNTYTTEEDNGNSLVSFNRQYLVEPDASGLLVAIINDGESLPNRVYESYRYSVNNEEMTGNRDVIVGSPIQYDRIQRCLDRQLGLGFKNAQLKYLDCSSPTQAGAYSSPVSMICETLPKTENTKKVGLAIECAGTLQQIILYKSMEKTLSA